LKPSDVKQSAAINNAEGNGATGAKRTDGKFEVIPTGGTMYNMGGLGERQNESQPLSHKHDLNSTMHHDSPKEPIANYKQAMGIETPTPPKTASNEAN